MGGRVRIWVLRSLAALGVAALGYYFSWWLREERISSPMLVFALALSAFYHAPQMLGSWLVYLAARRRRGAPSRPESLRVDVYVTFCGEPLEMVRRTLRAAIDMRGEHATYLLDDADDQEAARLARELAAGYLTRPDRAGAKAGNINAALSRTAGDVVVILDVDHAPAPDFLERTLGYFADPRVGFVQVMLSFENAAQSWIARAAVESSLDFHNPASMGMDGLGSVNLQGTNALIRRAALESIGGYRPGLAEDLATSIAIHAAGWRSVFVPEPLAPGLVPSDVAGWFTQQLKWSRGIFEVGLTSLPRLVARLTWGQRLAYAVRCTYHLSGPLIFVHLALLVGVLAIGTRESQDGFKEYLLHGAPLAIMFLAIRKCARSIWRHPSTASRIEWRALLLIYATWPVYTLASVMALLRIPLGFRSTPKRSARTKVRWLVPQVVSLVLLVACVVRAPLFEWPRNALLLYSAAMQVTMLLAFLLLARHSKPMTKVRFPVLDLSPVTAHTNIEAVRRIEHDSLRSQA